MPHKEKTEKKKDQAAAQIQLAPLFDEKSLKTLICRQFNAYRTHRFIFISFQMVRTKNGVYQ